MLHNSGALGEVHFVIPFLTVNKRQEDGEFGLFFHDYVCIIEYVH